MNGAWNLVIVLAIAGVIRAAMGEAWERYKVRMAGKVTPLAFRGGSYVPWGPVEKIRHYGGLFGYFVMAWLAFCMIVLIVRQ